MNAVSFFSDDIILSFSIGNSQSSGPQPLSN